MISVLYFKIFNKYLHLSYSNDIENIICKYLNRTKYWRFVIKHFFLILTAISLITISVFGSLEADQCEQLKGSWEWNSSLNQWQCLNAMSDSNTTSMQILTEVNNSTLKSVATESSKPESESIGRKILIYAATPVVAVGAVVAAIVIAPVWIVKKIFQ